MPNRKQFSFGQHFSGKVRRFFLAYTLQGRNYIRRMAQKRRGKCVRCGACCRLVHRCMFLRMENGVAICAIHNLRPGNCRIFPVDHRDVADRDLVLPNVPCGYTFPETERV